MIKKIQTIDESIKINYQYLKINQEGTTIDYLQQVVEAAKESMKNEGCPLIQRM